MKEYAIQLVLIVFSVVLGLYLSERIEERKSEKEAALLLSKIESEVSRNKAILENWVPYHRSVVNRLDSLKSNQGFIDSFIVDENALYDEVFTRGTVMGDMLSNEAWDIAKSHPLIVHLDYEKLLVLSRIYNQQEMTFTTIPKVIELFLSDNFNAEADAASNLRTFTNQFREIVSREIQLMNYIQEAEKMLEL